MRSNMNSERQPGTDREPDPDRASEGPNLTLIYGLVAVALLGAIGFAMLIVFPFYRHRH
jgi:hypothetical protein